MERSSKGRVSLEIVGRSNEGRDLYLAKVGTGPTKVLYITQQHGNEPLGTRPRSSSCSGSATAVAGWDAILSKLTVLVIPKVNPDGSERFQRQRGRCR